MKLTSTRNDYNKWKKFKNQLEDMEQQQPQAFHSLQLPGLDATQIWRSTPLYQDYAVLPQM